MNAKIPYLQKSPQTQLRTCSLKEFHRYLQNMKVCKRLWLLYKSHKIQWIGWTFITNYLCSTSHSITSTSNYVSKKTDGCNVLESSTYLWSPSTSVQILISISRLLRTDEDWNQWNPRGVSKHRLLANSSDEERLVAGHRGDLSPLWPNLSKVNWLHSQLFSRYFKAYVAYTSMYENQARFWTTALSLSIGKCLWIQIVQEAQLLHQLISAARDPRLTECLPSLTKLIGDPQQGQ